MVSMRRRMMPKEATMAGKAANNGVARRSFLKGVTAAGAAAVGSTLAASSASPAEAATPPATARVTARPTASTMLVERPGSDFMVDVLKGLGIDYVFANPGSSFRGFQASIV